MNVEGIELQLKLQPQRRRRCTQIQLLARQIVPPAR
jgi:hypothetical protein